MHDEFSKVLNQMKCVDGKGFWSSSMFFLHLSFQTFINQFYQNENEQTDASKSRLLSTLQSPNSAFLFIGLSVPDIFLLVLLVPEARCDGVRLMKLVLENVGNGGSGGSGGSGKKSINLNN